MKDVIVHTVSGAAIGSIMGILISAMFLTDWYAYIVVAFLSVVGAMVGAFVMDLDEPFSVEGEYPYPTPKA